jgi:hypothetical protein
VSGIMMICAVYQHHGDSKRVMTHMLLPLVAVSRTLSMDGRGTSLGNGLQQWLWIVPQYLKGSPPHLVRLPVQHSLSRRLIGWSESETSGFHQGLSACMLSFEHVYMGMGTPGSGVHTFSNWWHVKSG